MSLVAQTERPFSWPPGVSGQIPTAVNVATLEISDIGTTPLTLVTATVHVASILLPQNLSISNLGCLVTGIGSAVTAFWLALLDNSRTVRAVTGNLTTLVAGYQTQALVSPTTYVTPYAGMYYMALGHAFTTTAATVGAQAALPTVAAASGPPVYCGTSSTAATATPPTVGTQLGTFTGVAANQFFGYVA